MENRSTTHGTQIAQQKTIVKELKKSHNNIQTELAQARTENGKLRKALTAAQGREAGHERVDNGVQSDSDDPSDEGDEDEDEDKLLDAIHDGLVYCCSECGFEVVDGECQSCWTKHCWDEV